MGYCISVKVSPKASSKSRFSRWRVLTSLHPPGCIVVTGDQSSGRLSVSSCETVSRNERTERDDFYICAGGRPKVHPPVSSFGIVVCVPPQAGHAHEHEPGRLGPTRPGALSAVCSCVVRGLCPRSWGDAVHSPTLVALC